MAALDLVTARLTQTPGARFCAPCLAKATGIADPNYVRRIIELPAEYRPGLVVERARCDACHTERRTLAITKSQA